MSVVPMIYRKHIGLLAIDDPWPTVEVLRALVVAAEHLISDHACVARGSENVEAAIRIAKERLADFDSPPNTWVDDLGRRWRVPAAIGRLRFAKIPSHAALRRYVFVRDVGKCAHCGDTAAIPCDYDGVEALGTRSGKCLVPDHIVSIRNGGTHHPKNLQSLCAPCNSKKASTVDRGRR